MSLGAHMSVAGGTPLAPERGAAGLREALRRTEGLPVSLVFETPKAVEPVSKRAWDAVNLGRLRRLGMR